MLRAGRIIFSRVKKTIGIIELGTHHEVFRHFAELLLDSPCNIKLFCHKKMIAFLGERLPKVALDWYFPRKEESAKHFFQREQAALAACDHLLIITVFADYGAFARLARQYPCSVVIHNAHTFFAPDRFLWFRASLADRLRWLKMKLQRHTEHKQALRQMCQAFIFPSNIIRDYAIRQLGCPADRAFALPFAYYEGRGEVPKPLSEPFTITIPGTVHSQGRDYELVYRVLSQLALARPTRLVLLGRPKGGAGQAILRKFQYLDRPNLEVVTFSDYVPQKTYEQYLRQTHLLLLPLLPETQFHIYRERIGYSKTSGGISDHLRWGIPAVLPDFWPGVEGTIRYSDLLALTTLLEKWVENKQPFKTSFIDYSMEKLRTTLMELWSS